MRIKKPKLLFDLDPWMLGEEIPDGDIFFFQIPMSCFCSNTSYSFLKNYKRVLTHYKKFHMDFYMGTKDSNEVAESIVKALLERKNFGTDVNTQIVKWSYRMINFAENLSRVNVKELSEKKLWDLYNTHDEIHTKLYTYGWIPVAVDLFHNNFTKKLKSYLYEVCETKVEAESAFIVFTTPTKKTILAEEREDFLRIYKKFKLEIKKPSKNFLEVLNFHSKKWGHLGYIYAGNTQPFSATHYLAEMKDLIKSGISGESILKKEEQQLKAAGQNQKKLYKKYNVSVKYKNLFKTAQDFALTKLVRRHAQLFTLYSMHVTVLNEIAKRLNIPRYLLQYMTIAEVKNTLIGRKFLTKEFLQKRFKECVLYTEKNYEVVYQGNELPKIINNLGRVFDKNLKEITGQVAQPGYAKGKVKIILRAKDMVKMKQGDILVSIATDPDIIQAMKKAGAIVTEQGGITSHAAIVSRELGTPCIIGTKIATKIFKDGDMVEVDAIKGVVKLLKK